MTARARAPLWAVRDGLIVASLVVGSACHTMRAVTFDDLIARPASRVWVTAADHTVLVVDGAQVFRGRLVGFVEEKYRVFPPAEIQRVVARRFAPGKTVALVAASAAGATVAMVLLSGTGGEFDPCVGGATDCIPTTP